MKWYQFLSILVLSVVCGIAVNACSASQEAGADSGKERPFFIEVNQKLSDGRTVLCLYRQEVIGGYSAGMTMTTDCDWANAKVIK